MISSISDELSGENSDITRENGVSSESLKKFRELQKRREELSNLAKFKLEKYEEKKQTTQEKRKFSRPSDPPKRSQDAQKEWLEVRHYLNANERLSDAPSGRQAAQSGLEKTLNSAITFGDADLAERLSDRLADRQFAVAINDAFAAKRYSESKQLEKEAALRRKRKRLKWGFDHKERWEMKGNM